MHNAALRDTLCTAMRSAKRGEPRNALQNAENRDTLNVENRDTLNAESRDTLNAESRDTLYTIRAQCKGSRYHLHTNKWLNA